MASLLALGQKGALGHLIGKLFRAGAMGDRSLENFAHAQKELFELVRREPVHSRSGIDASLKQDLIRIDIPDSGNDLLIHQNRFDVTFAAEHGRFERGYIPEGASGSSQTIRKLRVPSGAPDQANGGDTLSPSHGYFSGMSPPWRKAVLVSLNGMSASVIFGLRNELRTRKLRQVAPREP